MCVRWSVECYVSLSVRYRMSHSLFYFHMLSLSPPFSFVEGAGFMSMLQWLCLTVSFSVSVDEIAQRGGYWDYQNTNLSSV